MTKKKILTALASFALICIGSSTAFAASSQSEMNSIQDSKWKTVQHITENIIAEADNMNDEEKLESMIELHQAWQDFIENDTENLTDKDIVPVTSADMTDELSNSWKNVEAAIQDALAEKDSSDSDKIVSVMENLHEQWQQFIEQSESEKAVTFRDSSEPTEPGTHNHKWKLAFTVRSKGTDPKTGEPCTFIYYYYECEICGGTLQKVKVV